MTLADFTDLLDRCGADPARWPSGAQAGAHRLLAGSAAARAQLAALQAVEQGLAETRDGRAPPGLAARATARAQARPAAPAWSVRAGWAAAAALALSVGIATGAAHGGREDPGATVAWALGSGRASPMRVDGRVLGLALAASLLANLFLGGMLAGRWMARPPAAPSGGGGFAPAEQVRQLPPAEHAAFVAAMQPHRPAIRAARQAVRQARARVEVDLEAPAYDPARTAADLAALRAAGAVQQAAVHQGLVEAMARLSPGSRAALVDHARRRRPGGVGNATGPR